MRRSQIYAEHILRHVLQKPSVPHLPHHAAACRDDGEALRVLTLLTHDGKDGGPNSVVVDVKFFHSKHILQENHHLAFPACVLPPLFEGMWNHGRVIPRVKMPQQSSSERGFTAASGSSDEEDVVCFQAVNCVCKLFSVLACIERFLIVSYFCETLFWNQL